MACCTMLTTASVTVLHLPVLSDHKGGANIHLLTDTVEQSQSLPHFNFKMHFSYNMNDLSFSSSCQSKLLDKTKTSGTINRGVQ